MRNQISRFIFAHIDLAHPSVRLYQVALTILAVSLCLQNITIVEIGGLSVRPMHLITGAYLVLFAGGCLRFRQKPLLPPLPFGIVILVFTLISLINVPRYGLTSLTLNYLLLYALVVLFMNIMDQLSLQQALQGCIWCSNIVLILVLGNALLHTDAILRFLVEQWDGHPNYPTIFSGGVNIEVSWLALLCLFHKPNKNGIIFLASIAALSILFESRAGMILVAVDALYFLLQSHHLSKRFVFRAALSAIVILVLFSIVAMFFGANPWERFTSIGSDLGSIGRISIWRNIPSVFFKSPLIGYGAGNAMDAIRTLSGTSFAEDNVHNLFLQILVDYGAVGFMFFIALVGTWFFKHFKLLISSPWTTFICVYLCIAFIQFRGGDPLLGLAIAGSILFDNMGSDINQQLVTMGVMKHGKDS